MKKRSYLETIPILALVGINLVIFFQDLERIRQITREDGLVESAESILYFISGCLLLFLYWQSKTENKRYFLNVRRNIFFLLCGILFIFFAGEEISWGQRIFNIASPEFFSTNNYQHETNFHNLPLFGFLNQHYTSGINVLFTSNAMLYEFFIFFCFLIPLLNRFSKKIRNLIERISFPVVPLGIAFLFPLNMVLLEVLERLELIGYWESGEMKEFNFAVLVLIIVIKFLTEFRKANRNLPELG